MSGMLEASAGGDTGLPELLDDDPVRVKVGLSAGHRRLVDLLCGLLDMAPTGPILVSGDWGAGKTSVLRVCQHVLDKRAEDRLGQRRTVFFEAWHYEGGHGLLPALLRCLWDVAREAGRPESTVAAARWRSLWRCGVVATTKVAPILASAFGLGSLLDVLKGISIKGLGDELRTLELAEASPPSDAVADLRQQFREFIAASWPGGPDPVVFVDDLDRCSPEGAVALLEGLRLLVAGQKDLHCRFVVALDREVLVQAVTHKFAGIPSFDGNRYLEKVFPVELHVPTPDRTEAALMVDSLLENSGVERQQFEALAGALAEPVFANPRLMRRAVNSFQLVRRAESQERRASRESEAKGSADADATLARWIVATRRWPNLRRLLQRRDDASWLALARELQSGALPSDPEARSLLSEPGVLAWLRAVGLVEPDPSAVARFRNADDRLRRLGL